jgi:hypothetical protein
MSGASRLTLATVLSLGLCVPASAATVTLVVTDSPGEGFNDLTAVSPVAGNPAITRGGQRLNAFQAAADVWGATLRSDVTIVVEAAMDPLAPCTPGGGVLGAAGPNSVFRDFPNAPEGLTWYAGALADSLNGSDLQPGAGDIGATFNSDVDSNPNCLTGITWWYGIGTPPAPNTIDFFTTVLHEIGHGVGFLTFVNGATGVKFLGFDDAFMKRLEDHSTGLLWSAMNNTQRAASAIDSSDLHWVGAEVTANIGVLSGGTASGHVRMYAPNPLQPGSSVSHWDTALSPNELMEPSLTSDAADLLTTLLLEDIGWGVGIFDDGFESGDTSAWSSAAP